MMSLLNALQEGRLIELPGAGKEESLAYLAHMIEAVPDLPGSPALAQAMIERERAHNTGLGFGVACPHVRVACGGELLCAVGWSPVGIDYGAADGQKVHLLVMYYIPEEQKNVYLKEISSLARATIRAIGRADGVQPISAAEDISTVRERLLDWVQAAVDAGVPETKVRMIRLETRQAAVDAAAAPAASAGLEVLSVRFVVVDGLATALCANAGLSGELEKDVKLVALLRRKSPFELSGWRFVFRQETLYGSRVLYDYAAVR